MPGDRKLDPQTERIVDQMDEDRATLVPESYAEAAPMFDRPVPARAYRVTLQMLERVITDLSEGQVSPEFTQPTGDVDRLPGDVLAALVALDDYGVKGLEFDAGEVASSADAFENLAGKLAAWRKDGSRGGERDTASVATGPEQRAVSDRASAEQLAADYD